MISIYGKEDHVYVLGTEDQEIPCHPYPAKPWLHGGWFLRIPCTSSPATCPACGFFPLSGDLLVTLELTSPTERMVVHCLYAGDCWSFSPGLYQEGYTFPAWPVRVGETPSDYSAQYSVLLQIETPPDTLIGVLGV